MNRNELLNANAADVTVKDLLMSLTQNAEATPKHLLGDVLGEWMTFLKCEDKSKSTLRNYESHTRNFIDWTTVDGVEDVTQVEILDYRDYLQNTKNRKPTSVNTILIALNLFFEFCVEKGYCESNPTKRVKKVKMEQLQPKSLNESTVNRLRNFIVLNCKARNDYTHLMIFSFMRHLGLRVSEVLNLRFEDIDVDDSRVDIKSGKGNKDRSVYMSDALVDVYKQYKANLHRSKNESQYVFQHHGQRYHDTAVRTFYWRLCREHGIKHVSPHQLRHTYAVDRLNKGAPMVHLQKLLGHANFNTTARYTQPSDGDLKKTANL